MHHDARFGVSFRMAVAAQMRSAFKHGNFMTGLCKLMGNNRPGKTGTDNCDFFIKLLDGLLFNYF